MCFNQRRFDPETRRRMIIGNLSLIFGILLWNSERWGWVHTASQVELNWLHAITGFLFGLYIALMLFGLRGARRCGAADSGKL